MKIYIGADGSAGPLKDSIKEKLLLEGYDLFDVSLEDSEVNTGYRVGKYISDDDSAFGIILCGNGFGIEHNAAIHPRTRIINCVTKEQVFSGRAGNNANILALGAKMMTEKRALELVEIFLNTEFGDGLSDEKIKLVKENYKTLEILREGLKET